MIYSEVIIVGGGPAGSTCAWKLKQHGLDCLILDKQEFPRTKLCAGWIQPQVIDDLRINVNEYPHSLVKFDKFHVHLHGRELKLKVRQYAIRRYEFDHWLLQRSGARIFRHEARNIKKENDLYIIDNLYQGKYLVGAGGSSCPVYNTFFRQIYPRAKDLSVVALEEEFPYEYKDENCHLWFLQNKLPGYSWYVPKSNGYLNIGIGGFAEKLKVQNEDIKITGNYLSKNWTDWHWSGIIRLRPEDICIMSEIIKNKYKLTMPLSSVTLPAWPPGIW